MFRNRIGPHEVHRFARCTERKWLQSEELLSLDLFSDLVKSGSSMGRDQFFTSFHKSKKVENVVIIR